jgi:hypothetical protein
MPAYYFNIRSDSGVVPDEEGMEFANDEAAHDEAVESARELLVDMIKRHRAIDAMRLEVVSNGAVVDTIYLRDMLD